MSRASTQYLAMKTMTSTQVSYASFFPLQKAVHDMAKKTPGAMFPWQCGDGRRWCHHATCLRRSWRLVYLTLYGIMSVRESGKAWVTLPRYDVDNYSVRGEGIYEGNIFFQAFQGSKINDSHCFQCTKTWSTQIVGGPTKKTGKPHYF